MTDAQKECLYVARYALARVVDVHVMPAGDDLPESLHRRVLDCIDEIDEFLPVGDLGDVPPVLRLERHAAAYREADA